MLSALEKNEDASLRKYTLFSLRKYTLSFDANTPIKWLFYIGLAIILAIVLTQIMSLDQAYKYPVTYYPSYI